MANSDDTGQMRVMRKEMNNRRTPMARGMMSMTPRKAGAQRGFGTNMTKGGGIFRSLKSSRNSALGS